MASHGAPRLEADAGWESAPSFCAPLLVWIVREMPRRIAVSCVRACEHLGRDQRGKSSSAPSNGPLALPLLDIAAN